MKYEDIKKPAELLQFMDIISYGFQDDEGKKYGSWNEEEFEKEVVTKWKLSSPERLLKVKIGHCFDQVELERDWFLKHKYNFKTYYIMFLLDEPNDYSTHTFLLYEENNKWNLFEHSDYFNRGIHEFSSLEEALKYEINHHVEMNRKYHEMDEEILKHLHVYQYEQLRYNVSFNEFIGTILEEGIEVRIDVKDF